MRVNQDQVHYCISTGTLQERIMVQIRLWSDAFNQYARLAAVSMLGLFEDHTVIGHAAQREIAKDSRPLHD